MKNYMGEDQFIIVVIDATKIKFFCLGFFLRFNVLLRCINFLLV